MDDNESKAGDLDLGGGEAESPADPFASVPADVPGEEAVAPAPVPAEGALGGEGATLDELEAPEADEPPQEPINGAEDEDPQPLPGGPEEVAAAAEEPEDGRVEAEPAPEPEPEPETKKSKKEGTAERDYVVLVEQEDGTWDKATPKPIKATNGESALRQAYAELVPADKEDSKTLVVIPVHYWKPKTVSAKAKVSRAVEIA